MEKIGPAKELVFRLSEALPRLKFVQEIEAVDDKHPGKIHTPRETQVRYYTSDQSKDAQQIAMILKQSVSTPVTVVRTHLAGSQVKSNPVIEIWFGRDEKASWNPAAP
jgi:hypothetical protein